jgi:hypothetical protein
MVAAAAITGNAEAIYKCTTAKGIVYQDRPCRDGTETDVQIVIPTGELAPKSSATQDDEAQANGPRVQSRFGAPKPGRASNDNAVTVTKPTDRKSGVATTDDARKKDARSAADNASVPMTAEQARKTEPTAKYYTTDVTSSDSETPEQMTCESPSGEKRRFILTNGKLTSI